MVEVKLNIINWCAWAPGLTTVEAWQRWAMSGEKSGEPQKPDVKFVPAMQRRRFSQLTKMALTVAESAGKDFEHLPTIFGSRHGELHRTRSLLDNIVAYEPLSPTGFSMSVHNTASGLYSILKGNTQPSTSIAAGESTLEHCFIEAFSWLASGEHSAAMVVIADEPVPEDYRAYIDYSEQPIAAAFLLSLDKGDDTFKLTLTQPSSEEKLSEMPLISFIRFLLGENNSYHLELNDQSWSWQRVR